MPPQVLSEARIPRWTKHVVTELGGRDPLGLSRVSFAITDYLLTGIITTTSRARYYSFYPWALWSIENTENPKHYSAFSAAFRRREAFMALSTLSNNPEASVVGHDAVEPRLQKSSEAGEVDTNFKVLPSNGMGGYGQYYGGSLYGLGLTRRTEDGIDKVASGRGQALAEAFEESVRATPYCKQQQFNESVIPLPILHKSGERFSLDSLNQRYADAERHLLRDLFFAWDRPDLSDTDIFRRHTLALILNSVLCYQKTGVAPKVSTVDHYLVYPTYYYGVLNVNDGRTTPYSVPPQLATCLGFWRQFSVHEYFTEGLELLLYAVLEVLNLHPAGMKVEHICDALLTSTFTATLSDTFAKATSPSELLGSVGASDLPTELTSLKAQKHIGAGSKRSEWSLVDLEDGSPQVAAAVGIGLLAVLYSKWRGSGSEFIRYIAPKAGSNLWIGTMLPSLDHWFRPGTTWHIALQRLIEVFILDQHDRIVYEKGRLESSWLHRLEGLVIKDQDYEPVDRSSRHWNCIMILRDLELLKIDSDGGISITTEGRGMLNRILKTDAKNS